MPTFPRTERGLWSRIERKIGHTVAPELREFCRRRGAVAAVLDARDDADQEEEFNDLCTVVETAVAVGLAPASEPLTPRIEGDDRWALWAELDARYQAGAAWPASRTYVPVEINPPQPFRLPPERTPMVRVRFDARLSQRALFAAVKAAWPGLSADGEVRRTRLMGDRGIALVRQVCLQDAPGTPWRRRLARWNEAQQEAWHFKDARPFQSAFRRAEAQLTGRRGGLAWYYDPLARLTPRELDERAQAGDKKAADRLLRWQARGAALLASAASLVTVPPVEAFAAAQRDMGMDGPPAAPARAGSRDRRRRPRRR